MADAARRSRSRSRSNASVFLAVFGLLTAGPAPLRELLPGVGVRGRRLARPAGVGRLVRRPRVADASDTYGVFALVIGLLSWFWLGAHLLLVAAEVNVVLRWRLWPRSLAGELEPADRLALRRSAEAARRDGRERIAVSFRDDER